MSSLSTCVSGRFAALRAWFTRHKAAGILLAVLLALALLILILHPHGKQTYLILGMDNYGSLEETGRSDVMMLVQIDFTRTKITAVTFARDMFVKPEGDGEKKINAVVRNNGVDALVSLMEKEFGVKLDGWFRVNFTTVIQLVDALGGAVVELTEEEVNYINRHAGRYPEYPLSEGPSRLCGGQALVYARCRQLDNDMGRGERQNKLIEGMVQSTKSMGISNLIAVFRSLKHAWHSSLSAGEQAVLLSRVLWLRGAQVEKLGLPFSGTWRYGNSSKGESGVIADLDANRTLLCEALGIRLPAESK